MLTSCISPSGIICFSFHTAAKIRVAEIRVDCINDDERGFGSSVGGNGADGEELKKFTDCVAAWIRKSVVLPPSRRSCKTEGKVWDIGDCIQ